MNLSSFKLRFSFLFCFTMLLYSCSDDEEVVDDGAFSTENHQKATEVDIVFEGTLNIIETGYSEEEEGRSTSFFPPCAIITVTPNGDIVNLDIDFGSGCELPNGVFVTGKILLSYGPLINNTREIDYSFNEFTYNEHPVSGGGQIERLLENQSGHPQSIVNEEITVGFPESTITATRTGLRVAEWVGGVGSGAWLDNVFHITGNWDTVFSNGFTRSGVVVDTLVKKSNCSTIVSGVVDIQQNAINALLDYGDGECDNTVTFLFNGQEYIIYL